jgi:hypothetical protein
LGLGWFVIGGLMIVSLIIGTLSVFLICLAILLISLSSQVLWILGSLELANNVSLSIRYLTFVWSLFNRPGSTIYSKLILGLAGVTQGWGDNEILQSSRILMLQALTHRIRNDEKDWDMEFSQVELMLNQRGFVLNDIERLVLYADLWVYPESGQMPNDLTSVIKIDDILFPSNPDDPINSDVLFDVLLSQNNVPDITRTFWMESFGLSTGHNADETIVGLEDLLRKFVVKVDDLEDKLRSVNNDAIVVQLLTIRDWLSHAPNDTSEMIDVFKGTVRAASIDNPIRNLLSDFIKEARTLKLIDQEVQCDLLDSIKFEVNGDKRTTIEGVDPKIVILISLCSFVAGIVLMVPFIVWA